MNDTVAFVPRWYHYLAFLLSLCCWFLLIFVIAFFMANPVGAVDARPSDWSMQIDCYAGGGHTYCIMGEKTGASDGIDVYDVPHPPFQPEGRAFVFIKQPSFASPHNLLWMEYRHLHGLWRVWNLTFFYVPMNGQGTDVNIQWDMNQVCSSRYNTVILWNNWYVANMKETSSYTFFSPPYQMTRMKIYCSNLFKF